MDIASTRLVLISALVFGSGLSAIAWAAQPIPVVASVYFSPGGGAQQAIIAEVGNAKSFVRVQAYSFTNPMITRALTDAQARGVDVAIILDKTQRTQRYSAATYLVNRGIQSYVDSKHAIAHNKIIVIDGQTVITGSYNFTNAAESKNAENLLVIKSQQLADIYLGNWEDHRNHSEPYVGQVRN